MLLTFPYYKHRTSLIKLHIFKINKRFSGNIPDKFASLFKETCKRGAGCAMQANVVNSIVSTNKKTPLVDTQSTNTTSVDAEPKKIINTTWNSSDITPTINKYNQQKIYATLVSKQTENNQTQGYFCDTNSKIEIQVSTETTVEHPEMLLEGLVPTVSFGVPQDVVAHTEFVQRVCKIKSDKTRLEENFNQNNVKEEKHPILQDILKKVKDLHEDKAERLWSDKKAELLKDITALLKNYMDFSLLSMEKFPEMSRDTEEFIKLESLYKDSNFLCRETLEHLKKDPIKNYRTLNQMEEETQRLSEALHIIEKHSDNLPEPIFHELARRAGILVNNDAIYTNDIDKEIVIVKAGQGSSLHYSCYTELITNAKKLKIYSKILTEEDHDMIFNKVQKGDYFIGLFKNKNNILSEQESKFIDSTDEIHMHIIIEQNLKEKKQTDYLSIGCFTSSKEGTVILSNKQYINKNEGEFNKKQRFRPFKQFLYLDKNYIEKYHEASSYATSENYEGNNIKEKIVNSILENKQEFIKNPIREPLFISRNMITDLMLKKYKHDLNEVTLNLNKYKTNLKTMPTLLQEQTERIRLAQYNKDIKEQKEAICRKLSSNNIKDLFKAQDNLQKDKEDAKIKLRKK